MSYLGDWEAEFGQLSFSHQRDGDAVGQNQVAVDDVLDDVVAQTTKIDEGRGEEEEEYRKRERERIRIVGSRSSYFILELSVNINKR